MPELDTLRGIAVLMVFFFHAFAGDAYSSKLVGFARTFSHACVVGRSGVNLFFILSGFLITGILFDSRKTELYWRRFYVRRALRILPAYYAVLVLLALATLVPKMPYKVSWQFLGFSFVYLANMTEIFGVKMQYAVLWSLAVEEHFYLGWPWVVRWLNLRGIAISAAMIVVLSPVIRAITFLRGGVWNGTVLTWNSLDGLAMGALLALALRATSDQRRATRIVSFAALGVAVCALLVGLPHGILRESCDYVGKGLRTTVENSFYLSVVACFLLIGTGKFYRAVKIKWLQFFGYISYGFYLMHVLIMNTFDSVFGQPSPDVIRLFVRAAVIFAACTAVCWYSRETFEAFFLRLKNRFDGSSRPSHERDALVAAVR